MVTRKDCGGWKEENINKNENPPKIKSYRWKHQHATGGLPLSKQGTENFWRVQVLYKFHRNQIDQWPAVRA